VFCFVSAYKPLLYMCLTPSCSLEIPLAQIEQMTYTDRGELKQVEKDLSYYLSVHFRSHMDWSGFEHGLLF